MSESEREGEDMSFLEDLVRALHDVTKSRPDTMDCPVLDCPGRVEAQCHIWFDISPEGVPWAYGIGWKEGGQILCSDGGDHVPIELQTRLAPMFQQLAAHLEHVISTASKEDLLP